MRAQRWVGSSSSARRNKLAITSSTSPIGASALFPTCALMFCSSGSCRRPTVLASLVRSAGARDVSAAPRLLVASTCVGSGRGDGGEC